MEWSSKHDIFLCTEILITEPFKFRKGSLDRGRLWTVVANNLNRIEEVHFNVKQRGVRERWEVIQSRWQARMRNEEKASGIAPEPESDLDNMIQEITEKERLAEEGRGGDEKIKKAESERETAEHVRKQAMETFNETEKRSESKTEDECLNKSTKRKRRSGSDSVEYLREKSSLEMKLRAEELAVKKKQLELDEARQNSFVTQQKETLTALMQMQQQQNFAIMQMFERLVPKKS